MNLDSSFIYCRGKINSVQAFSGRGVKAGHRRSMALTVRRNSRSVGGTRAIKRNNFRGPEETETAKVIARRVIHSPHGNVLFLSLSLSFFLLRGGTKEVTESSKIIIRSRRIIYSRAKVSYNKQNGQLYIIRDETMLICSSFSVNGLRSFDFYVLFFHCTRFFFTSHNDSLVF